MAGKPDVLELLGMAFNASSLELTPGHERPLDRVAALGAAAAEVACGADLKNLPLAAMQEDVYRRSAPMEDLMLEPGTPDERDVLAAELGQLFCHIRFGGHYKLLPRSIPLFARWLRTRRAFEAIDEKRIARFASRLLHEWLSDRCIVCGGSGRLEITAAGNLVKANGRGQRNARFTACRSKSGDGCMGTGRASISHQARASWLELSRADYDAERWSQKFTAALTWIELLIVGRIKRPLTAQLERRKRRISP
jgi:hypothetical protein